MLSVFDHTGPLSRRAMLSIGSLGLGGLALSDLLAAKAHGFAEKNHFTSGKSVIFLLQHGGPTQFETYDPKMDAPEAIRTVGGVTQTAVPGVHFGSTLKRLAAHADKLAVVRSYQSGSNGHSTRPIIGEATNKANMGSIYSRIVGTNHSKTGMPTNVALDPTAITPDDNGPDVRFGKFTQTGTLGKSFEPFVPGGGSDLQKNMKLVLPKGRLDNRQALLTALDSLKNNVDSTGVLDGIGKFRAQAYDMLIRGVADAFDINKEDDATIARYDTSQFINDEKFAYVKNGQQERHWYQTNARSLGKLLLLARRLCEAGCGFVTVTTQFVWDMHADQNNVGVTNGMDAVVCPYDHAVSAFIEDCEARGLSDDILLVTTGEMGRTPRINKNGGRDHWGRLTPLMLYGGGMTHGQVIGQSTRDGGEPLSGAVNSDNLVATILHSLFDIGELRLEQSLPTDLVRYATTGSPIPGLL